MYRALIRPILDYGSVVYINNPHVKELDKLQYRCITLCIGAMKSTPINAMQVESEETSLKIRWKYLTLKYIYKKMIRRESDIIFKIEKLERLMMNNKFWINKQKKSTVIENENNVYLKKLWHNEGQKFKRT